MRRMTDTGQLLRDYAERDSEEAFRELVTRYIDLVYSVALRRLGGNTHLVEDIVQTVFSELSARRSARTKTPRKSASAARWKSCAGCSPNEASPFRWPRWRQFLAARLCSARQQVSPPK